MTYKEWAAYRTHSMISIFVGPVFYLVQMFIWTAVYSSSELIGSMTLGSMLTYYAVTALLNYLTMDFADWNLQMLIHTGKYTSFALRPVNHMLFAFFQKIGHRFLGVIFEFIPVLLIFVWVFRIDLVPYSLPAAVLSLILCYIMNFSVNYAIGTTAFWLTKTGGLRGVIMLIKSIFAGSLIPLTFFPAVIQKVMFFLPFQYISYIPAMIFTGSTNLGGMHLSVWSMVGIQAAYTLLFTLLAGTLYHFGNRRYTGVGA